MMTTEEVAKHFSASENAVRSWINAGELAAINVAPAGSKRKIWRISQDALKAFERARCSPKVTGPIPRWLENTQRFV